jgi:hypothetical protein
LSGPIIVFGARVVVVVPVVPLDWSCAVTAVCGAEVVLGGTVVVDWPELVVFVAGEGFVVELPFFFALAVDVVCAITIDPVIRNALIQKLTTNFRYRFIDILFPKQVSTSITPLQYTEPCPLRRYNFRAIGRAELRPSACCDTTYIFQSASADLNFMQSG